MSTADTDSGTLISERVAGGILPKVLTTPLPGPVPAPGRRRAAPGIGRR